MSTESLLKMLNLRFNRIEFVRVGDKGSEKPNIEITAEFLEREKEGLHKTIVKTGIKKPNEYNLNLELEGVFALENADEINEDIKKHLVTKNTVAIMLPYIRSEVTLLTAQPEMESLIMPPINVNAMEEVDENESE